MATSGAERQAKYSKTAKGRATHRKAQKRWARANRHKTRAHGAVRRAVRRGDLERPDTCEQCSGNEHRIEASHDDYDRPLEVEWLCAPCHRRKDGLA